MKRQKSISSEAASISAWCAVFDWPCMVAATMRARHGPASSSAARRNTAARCSHRMAAHSRLAALAARMACVGHVRVGGVEARHDVAVGVRHHHVEQAPGGDALAADDGTGSRPPRRRPVPARP
jgi:hypothetical protein